MAKLENETNSEQLRRFLLVTHNFLILYLLLHNLIIPLSINLFRHHPLTTGIHFWFIYQFILHGHLKLWGKYKQNNQENIITKIPMGHWLVFGLTGTITRLILEIVMPTAPLLSSSFGSILLAEISSLIFYALALTHFRPIFDFKDLKTPRTIVVFFLSIALQGLLFKVERNFNQTNKVQMNRENPTNKKNSHSINKNQEVDSSILLIDLSNSIKVNSLDLSKTLKESILRTIYPKFLIKNSYEFPLHLRLETLDQDENRFKFIKLYVLKPGESINLPLKFKTLYRILTPTHKEIDSVYFFRDFPTGKKLIFESKDGKEVQYAK